MKHVRELNSTTIFGRADTALNSHWRSSIGSFYALGVPDIVASLPAGPIGAEPQSFAAGDDELAKKALKRKQEHEKLVVALQDQLNAARGAAASLKRQLEAMKAKRSLATLSARQRAADFRKKMQTVGCEVSSELDDDAFAKFERLRNRVEQSEAEAEAMAELRGTATATEDFDDEFEPSDEADIDSQLAELKKKVAK